MEFLTRRFSAGDVIRGADISNSNLQSWMKRGIITGHSIEGGGSPGRHRAFSWLSVIEIATAAALIQIGVSSPQDAFRAAQRFTHTSDGPEAMWVGDDENEDPLSARLAGFPFHHTRGETYLYVSGDRSFAQCEDGARANLTEINRRLRKPLGFVALNVSAVFMDVMDRLDMDGRVVLDVTYGLSRAS